MPREGSRPRLWCIAFLISSAASFQERECLHSLFKKVLLFQLCHVLARSQVHTVKQESAIHKSNKIAKCSMFHSPYSSLVTKHRDTLSTLLVMKLRHSSEVCCYF